MNSCVILAGGAGTRLWPLSDTSKPKQFLNLFAQHSMLVETSRRVQGMIPLQRQFVLTGQDYAALVDEQFAGDINVMAEPMAKNTAPCILWATLRIAKSWGGGTVVVMPSDHVIKEERAFQSALQHAIKQAERGCIVTFGVQPTHPETGYGYIEVPSEDYRVNESAEELVAFHEKPDALTAQRFLDAGHYLWNSGMFIFDAQTMLEEFRTHAPEVWRAFEGVDPDNVYDVARAFDRVPSISIDYAVMEKTDRAYCIPASFGWSDVGGYRSLHAQSKRDAAGNVANGAQIILQDTTDSYVSGDGKIVCIGLNNVVVIRNGDNVLVADMDKAAQVGEVAKAFRK